MKCKEEVIPFMKLNDYEFKSLMKNGEIIPNVNIKFTNFTPSLSQKEMFDKLNSEIDDYNSRIINEETESDFNQTINCNYYDTHEFIKSEFNSNKKFSILHINIHSIMAYLRYTA